MTLVRRLTLLPLLIWAAACATSRSTRSTDSGLIEAETSSDGVVLLVSIDGFRPDYLDPAVTPNLVRLGDRGVRAEALIPSFPTKTFPNHYTLVTGLRPDHHGIVANNIWDPDMQATYGLGIREAIVNEAWYGGTPVWVSAERAGMVTAPLFWPGSEAPIGGVRPSHGLAYDGDMPHEARVDWVVARLAGPAGDAARFATLYFDDVDGAGHRYGPRAPETRAAAAQVDTTIGYLIRQLAARGLEDRVDVIVVSDHGMSQLSQDRVLFLEDYLDTDSLRVVDWSPVLAIWPDEEDVDRVYGILSRVSPHLHVYRRGEIPARYEFGTHKRVAPIVGILDPGWSMTNRGYFDRNAENFDGGTHGYDQNAPDMRALFLASGPSFRERAVVPPIPNVDVYSMIMTILGLPPAPNDGSLERARSVLVR